MAKCYRSLARTLIHAQLYGPILSMSDGDTCIDTVQLTHMFHPSLLVRSVFPPSHVIVVVQDHKSHRLMTLCEMMVSRRQLKVITGCGIYNFSLFSFAWILIQDPILDRHCILPALCCLNSPHPVGRTQHPLFFPPYSLSWPVYSQRWIPSPDPSSSSSTHLSMFD